MPKTIVSFTTLPNRIGQIKPMIDTLLAQTVKPDEIHLWIPKYVKRTKETTPENIIPPFIRQKEIKARFCEDFGPHTKLIPTLKEAKDPNTMIITADDDTLYPTRWLESLINYANNHPDHCVGFRGRTFSRRKFPLLGFRRPLRYKGSELFFSDKPNFSAEVDIVTGCWGALYRRWFFDEQLLDLKLCPPAFFNDDIWNSGHLAKKGIKRMVIGLDQLFGDIQMIGVQRLWDSVNNGKGLNDKTIRFFKADW